MGYSDTKALPQWVEDMERALVDQKKKLLGNSVEILTYYLQPGCADARDMSGVPDVLGEAKTTRYFRRVDTTASAIAQAATAHLMSAILPRGVNSILVTYPIARKKLMDAKSKDGLLIIKQLEDYMTSTLRLFLRQPEVGFQTTLEMTTSDFLTPGTGIALLENPNRVRPLPLHSAYLGSSSYDQNPTVLYEETFSALQLMAEHPKYAALLEVTKPTDSSVVIRHLFVPLRMAVAAGLAALPLDGNREEVEEGFYKLFLTPEGLRPDITEKMRAQTYVEIVYTRTPHSCILEQKAYPWTGGRAQSRPFYIARMGAEPRAVYGFGCGQRALSNIMLLNTYTVAKMEAAVYAFRPTLAVDRNISFSPLDSHVESNVSGDMYLDYNFGSINAITSDSTDVRQNSGQPFAPLVNPAEHFALFQAETIEAAKAIEAAFNAFLMSGTEQEAAKPRTAFEISERVRSSIRQFKAAVSSYYRTLLLPLLETFMVSAMSKWTEIERQKAVQWGEQIRNILGMGEDFNYSADYTVSVYSFEEQQSELERRAALQEYLQLVGGAQLLSEEEMTSLLQKLKEAYIGEEV